VNNVRTVSDTKRSFYTIHTRPINSIFRRVVDELMVEMHLLSVNVDFRYDPIYALGVVTAFHRFMQGYHPEADVTSIFHALCQSLQDDPQRYRHDADRLEQLAHNLGSAAGLEDWLKRASSCCDGTDLHEAVRAIASNPNFKYSRLFAIGLLTLLELADAAVAKDDSHRLESLTKLCAALNLPEDKLQKDLDLYRSNLEKITQARIVMEDILKADQKKREEREKAAAAGSTEASADGSP